MNILLKNLQYLGMCSVDFVEGNPTVGGVAGAPDTFQLCDPANAGVGAANCLVQTIGPQNNFPCAHLFIPNTITTRIVPTAGAAASTIVNSTPRYWCVLSTTFQVHFRLKALF